MEILIDNFKDFEQRDRANFVNCLSGFKSLCLVGTKDFHENENLAPISSVFHLGANPALMGMIFRPHTTPRHSLENIFETKFFTLNHVNESIVKNAHQCSARYDKNESEFEMTSLTADYKNEFFAPFVKESNLKIALEYVEHQTLEVNKTVLVIAKVLFVYMPSEALREDKSVDIEKAGTITVSGLDCYHSTQEIVRLSYAKKDKELREL